MPAIVNRYTAQTDDPWVYPLSLEGGLVESPNSVNSHKTTKSAKTSQRTIPPRSELRTLQPSIESPTKLSSLPLLLEKFETKPLQFINGERSEAKPPRKHGCRGGPLPPDKKKHTKVIRKAGACWPCRFVKVQVSCTRSMLAQAELMSI